MDKATGVSVKILIVDDEEDFLAAISKRLGRRGHRADTATTCRAALLQIEKSTPDVIVLDVMLPDRDGIDCLKEIKERWAALPVILLTGHASIRAGIDGVALGAEDYCLKPIETDALLERIMIAYNKTR